ncbi:protocatechuate 4,5-dioxygenase beta chain [Arthrobacter ginsengisoli]|uniref:Protocatechuate 4,5-dioxygenase beta chain n=1 Tax=Arthrobacter ginsengisoli TaxID=1356565 RepID=A0ABU1UDT3_9MICC|nr:class III extradiol dioxygenase family protein [Arthrobacter ginsengisoli]MDR7083275.1 protocatechuate 4,5-dioxygenase beta chain [Arthrobacter ginsengisoli]
MAEIVAGIGISHVPALTPFLVTQEQLTPEERGSGVQAFFDAGEWLREQNPDVAVLIYNDHGAEMSLALVPTFLVGAAEEYPPADEGNGIDSSIPEFPGDPDLSWHIIDNVVPAGFDLAVGQKMAVDHGLWTPMRALFGGHREQWPVKVVPVVVNVVQQPTPTARRCFELGQAIGQALRSYPEDTRIAVIGTGGMSHQLQGPRAGYINEEFDRSFLSRIVEAPEELADLTNAEYVHLAGSEGAELVMWLVMRGIMNSDVDEVLSGYHVPVSSTGAGVVAMTNR